MNRALLLSLLLAAALGATAQSRPSATARAMLAQGMADIHAADTSIRVSLMYARPDNFTGRTLYTDLREALARPECVRAAVKAQRALHRRNPHLHLIIYDATRPMRVQQQMWDVVKGTAQQNYVSNPARGGGMHNYGMALDLTLCDDRGDTLAMGTRIDHLGPEAHIDREDDLVARHKLTPRERANRRLLRTVMREAGFMPLRTEWWHFNLCTRATAKARYKPVR